MMFLSRHIIAVFCIANVLLLCRSQDYTYISDLVKNKFVHAFAQSWKLEDIATLHYAIKSFKILDAKIPISEKVVCSALKRELATTNSLESIYHLASISKEIPLCATSEFISNIGKKILSARERENLKVEELYYIVEALKSITNEINEVPSIVKSLKKALKLNDTLINHGFAYHIGTIFDKAEGEVLFTKINSIISQADETDFKYLQFSNGLTTTASIIEGIYKLSESLNKPPPLKIEQLVKFHNYFLSLLPVTRPRSVFSLLNVLSVMANNKYHAYASVNLINDQIISKDSPIINIRVSDVFGAPLFKNSIPTVTFTAGKKSNGESATASKPLKASSNKVMFTTSIAEQNLITNHYVFKVSVKAADTENKILVNPNQYDVNFQVLYNFAFEKFQLGFQDSEQSSLNLESIDYPNTLKTRLVFDSQQRLIIKYSLKDADYGTKHKVQQAFVKLVEKYGVKEATFICTSDSNGNYKVNIDFHSVKTALQYISGEYDLYVIIGDVLLVKSVNWKVGSIKFKNIDEKQSLDENVRYYYELRPEIKHLFREPEKRPPTLVSNLFTLLALTPLVFLIITWLHIGINLKGSLLSLSALGFHAGLGSIFVLFGVFWLKLNMFQTLNYLLLIGGITFVFGNKLLRSIADKRKK